MFDCMNVEAGGTSLAPAYFSSFVVIATFILINLFVMIIVEDFDEVDRQSRGLNNHTVDAFKLAWSQYDPFGRNEIEWKYLEPLLRQVPPPLGLSGKGSFKEFTDHVAAMGLMAFDGKLHYKDVLLACHRVAFGNDVPDHVMTRIGTHPQLLHRTLSRAVVKRKKKLGELPAHASHHDEETQSAVGITKLENILASTFIQRCVCGLRAPPPLHPSRPRAVAAVPTVVLLSPHRSHHRLPSPRVLHRLQGLPPPARRSQAGDPAARAEPARSAAADGAQYQEHAGHDNRQPAG